MFGEAAEEEQSKLELVAEYGGDIAFMPMVA